MGEKHQTPNPKSQTNPNDQDSKLRTDPSTGASVWVIGVLDFRFVWDLVLGIWDFGRSPSGDGFTLAAGQRAPYNSAANRTHSESQEVAR
jgi:hypothetical protein